MQYPFTKNPMVSRKDPAHGLIIPFRKRRVLIPGQVLGSVEIWNPLILQEALPVRFETSKSLRRDECLPEQAYGWTGGTPGYVVYF